MNTCKVCKKPLNVYGTVTRSIKIEIETCSSKETYYFDTESCLAKFVTEKYVVTGNNTY